ncbi:MAG TPA: M20/M25/M40 family metallo-hydrolase [Candidatus Acidoferrales bacterium]|nr:M20/M25/M40 family metallo-hydrolase [Candidatus Acidoferrales bacterium]
MASSSSPGLRRILLSLLALAAILALTLAGLQPPAPKLANAPPGEFSANRALDTLHRILGSDHPHPIGTPAADAVRDRIVAELTKLGYQPQIQTAFACGDFGSCATVNNVLARLDGTDTSSSDAVLLAAHYDSVPAGPGDSDDGVGVAAVLEIARALKAMPAPRHSVIFLFDEGEEAGLLGARAFVDSHPWAKDVRAAVNLDARGTSGPSLLFETGEANEWAMRLYAQHAARPATSSIFYTVYEMLPNDTDFTIFKAAGYEGLNFAFIGDEVHYHTPLDNSANVTPESVQHQGENALPAVVAFANADLSHIPRRESVFFDLLGRATIRWPAKRTALFGVLAALLVFLEVAWLIHTKRLTLRDFLMGCVGWLVTIAVTGALAMILRQALFFAGSMPVNWIAHQVPFEIAFWLLGAAVVFANGVFFVRRAGFWGLWSGVWVWWALLAVVISWRAPGLSYVVLVPAAVAALAGLPATLARSDDTASFMWDVAAILPLAAAAIVGFGPASLLYDALGDRGLPVIALLVGLLLTPIAPLCADLLAAGGIRAFAFLWIPILAGALATVAAVVLPPYSSKAPERVNIEYWRDADSGKGRWIVEPASGHLPEPLRLAATFHRATDRALPWLSAPAFFADAPSVDASAPTFTIQESGQANGRHAYRALLRSERGAPSAAVFFPPDADVQDVRVGGKALPPEVPRIRQYFNGWAMYRCDAMSPDGVEIDFSLPVGKPVEVSAADESYGLPPDGAFLLNARPLKAAPSQDGDTTIVTRRVQILP